MEETARGIRRARRFSQYNFRQVQTRRRNEIVHQTPHQNIAVAEKKTLCIKYLAGVDRAHSGTVNATVSECRGSCVGESQTDTRAERDENRGSRGHWTRPLKIRIVGFRRHESDRVV